MMPLTIKCRVRATCDLLASEDPRRVRRALESVLEGTDAECTESVATAASASCASLLKIRQTIQSRASGRAWRRRLRLNRDSNSTWVYLNKQAAAIGVIALCAEADESPLGPITVSVRSAEIGEVIDWLAPRSES